MPASQRGDTDLTLVPSGASCGSHHICLGGICGDLKDVTRGPDGIVDEDFVEMHTTGIFGELKAYSSLILV